MYYTLFISVHARQFFHLGSLKLQLWLSVRAEAAMGVVQVKLADSGLGDTDSLTVLPRAISTAVIHL